LQSKNPFMWSSHYVRNAKRNWSKTISSRLLASMITLRVIWIKKWALWVMHNCTNKILRRISNQFIAPFTRRKRWTHIVHDTKVSYVRIAWSLILIICQKSKNSRWIRMFSSVWKYNRLLLKSSQTFPHIWNLWTMLFNIKEFTILTSLRMEFR
jgi:hypothetical protein